MKPLKLKLRLVIYDKRQTEYTTAAYDQFFDQLENHISLNCMTGTNYVIGDFNIDVMQDTLIKDEYLNLMERHGLFICDTKNNTRPDSNTNLDHLFTNEIQTAIRINTLSYDKFDHKLMMIKIDKEIEREKPNSQATEPPTIQPVNKSTPVIVGFFDEIQQQKFLEAYRRKGDVRISVNGLPLYSRQFTQKLPRSACRGHLSGSSTTHKEHRGRIEYLKADQNE
ncbi:hypothetical protein Bhyg_12090 [Pseudolycoriella hygida]|uniref:Endonuclease/exonuclease/phosphatase domain-containing protein n=1 Tax=Pseudolycoriella hygida TaxID=35572 RepID=A0A9Q0S0J1_9DIPT|nr:hypothetical protein Bhyg_12090 [Pseudolycoriella hygida]